MPASSSSGAFSVSNDIDPNSETMLQIVRASDTVLEAHVLRGNREITDERPASAFNWTRSSGNATADATWNNAHRSMKQITLTTAEINGNMQFICSYTETQGNYGTVQVNNSLVASHTPATADANDVFTIENGMLKVTTSTTNGTDYALNVGTLSVNNGFTGTLTSTATFSDEVQTKEIDFIYDHNGMRTAKIVSENGRVEMTEYILHGKLITHPTKRTVAENGAESTEELHFFYDAQKRPAKVCFNGVLYSYVHNLQGDIVAIVDTAGNPVVEYKYDAWGSPLSTIGSLKTTLGEFNPFRYRGYVYDEETNLYYLRGRYYNPTWCRFINADSLVGGLCDVCTHNVFAYCKNNSVMLCDTDGCSPSVNPSPSRPNDWDRQFVDTWGQKKAIDVRRNKTFESIKKGFVGAIKFLFVDPWRAVSVELAGGVGFGGSVSCIAADFEVDLSAQVNNSDYLRASLGTVETGNMTKCSAGYSFGPFSRETGTTSEHVLGAEGCACGFFTSSFEEKMACPANKSSGLQSSYDLSLGLGAYLGMGGEATVTISLSNLFHAWGNTINDVLYSDAIRW